MRPQDKPAEQARVMCLPQQSAQRKTVPLSQ